MAIWLEALPSIVMAVVIGIGPGALVAASAGFRRLSLVGLAPLFSAVVIGGSAVVAPWIHLSWGPLPLAIGTMLGSAVLIGLRAVASRGSAFKIRPVAHWSLNANWATVVGIIISACIIGARMLAIFKSPDYVSQTADNIFHLNAIRYILQTGNGSSLNLNNAIFLGVGTPATSGSMIYPGAWHDLVAVVVQVTHATIPVAVSGSNIAIAAVFWPISAVFMARTVFGGSKLVDISAGLLASCFSAFPYLLVDWGVLYPNFYGMAVVPAFIALCAVIGRRWSEGALGRAVVAVLVLVSTAGLMTVHPNTFLSALVVVIPLWSWQLIGAVRRARGKSDNGWQMVRWWLLAAGLTLVLGTAWIKLRPFPISRFNVTWPPYETPAQAVGEFLLTTHSGWKPGYVSAALLLLGLSTYVWRRRSRWLLVSSALWAMLFVTVVAYHPSPVRAFLTGGWYDDYKRIAAGFVLTGFLVCVGSVRYLWCALVTLLRRESRTRRGSASSARAADVGRPGASLETLFSLARRVVTARGTAATQSSVIVLIALVLACGFTQKTTIAQAAAHAATNYSLGPGSPIMSEAELDLYEELPQYVPKDAVIAGNPWNGSAWAYFVSGRKVLFPHVQTPFTPDRALIAQKLNQVATDRAVCSAVRRLDVRYVIDSDELIYLPGNPDNQKYPGISGLDKAAGFKLVASVQGDRLYEITACYR